MFFAAAFAVFAAALSVSPVPQSSDPGHWWTKRFGQKKAEIAKGGSRVVFLGDSITHYFELGGSGMGKTVWDRYWAGAPYNALNLGFAADRTEHLLWRITEGGQLDGYEAKAIVLMIGTNNTGQRTDPPAVTIAGVKKILSVIAEKQPKATTVLCAILPRGEKADHPMRRRNAIVNRELQKYADGRKVVWCDFTDKFLFADGTMSPGLMPDFLHPREEGYMIWTSAILPIVKECFEGGAFPIASVYPARPCREAFSDEKSMSLRPVTRICQPSWRGPDWWGDRLSRNLGAIRSFKGKIDVVFAGDSITHFWEDYGGAEYASLTNRYRVLNLGYGGDQTQNVLWRFENGELDGYSAKAAVLMIGTNNNGVGGADPEVTAEGIKACVALLRKKQPNAKVFLMSLLPRAVGVSDGDPSRDNGADGRNRRTNQILRDYADGKDVVFIDIYDRYLVDGKIPKALMADRIHPTEKGYAIWRRELESRLAEAKKAK